MRETYPANEVASEEGEEDYPEGEEHLAVEQMPAVCKVGYGEELQGEGYLYKAESNLYAVHPVTRFRHGLEPRWEDGKEGEWQGKGEGEAEHSHGRSNDAA